MVSAELRYYALKRRREIEALKYKSVKTDETLDRKRYNTVSGK